jgi:hypothetical protein
MAGGIQEALGELSYDPVTIQALRRALSGLVHRGGGQVVISGKRYVPVAPNALMRSHTVAAASEIGNRVRYWRCWWLFGVLPCYWT